MLASDRSIPGGSGRFSWLVGTVSAVRFLQPEDLERHEVDPAAFTAATPFPHVVIDDFLPAEMATAAAVAFPSPDGWFTFHTATEPKKSALADSWRMPDDVRHVLAELNGAVALNWLEHLTSIGGLIPDPHYVGGGMHQTVSGGLLKVHADFNRHDRLRSDRRLNLLIYLNQHWDDAWGGHLELWSADMSRCERRVAPVFNRCVIFATTDESFHGHPDPMKLPDGVVRRSLALYYYSNGRDDGVSAEGHSTLFRERPGEAFAAPPLRVGDFVPPIVKRLLRRS